MPVDVFLAGGVRTAIGGFCGVFAEIPATVLGRYSKFSSQTRPVAQSLLASRKPWTRSWLQQVAGGKIDQETIPLAMVRRMLLHQDAEIKRIIDQQWGAVSGATTEQMKQQMKNETCGICATPFCKLCPRVPSPSSFSKFLHAVSLKVRSRRSFFKFLLKVPSQGVVYMLLLHLPSPSSFFTFLLRVPSQSFFQKILRKVPSSRPFFAFLL